MQTRPSWHPVPMAWHAVTLPTYDPNAYPCALQPLEYKELQTFHRFQG